VDTPDGLTLCAVADDAFGDVGCASSQLWVCRKPVWRLCTAQADAAKQLGGCVWLAELS
jgi:hypothetical protein